MNEKKEKKPILISENRDFKGVWIPERLYLSREFSPNEKFLLIEIHSLTKNESRLCFASNRHFADFVGLKENSIQKMLLKFENAGYIKRFYEYKENSREIERRIIKLTQLFYDSFVNESENNTENEQNFCQDDGKESIRVIEKNQWGGGKNVGDKYNNLSNTDLSNIKSSSPTELNSPKGVSPSGLNPTLSEKEVDTPQKEGKPKPDFNKWVATKNHIISTMKRFGYEETREETYNAILTFQYYYQKYKSHMGKNHPRLKDAAMAAVIQNFIRGFPAERNITDADMYADMIDRHFQTEYREDVDYNICHFMTDEIRNNLYMQVYR